MGNYRKPGWICTINCSDDGLLEDGTNCLAASPIPGPTGIEVEVIPDLDANLPQIEPDLRSEEEKSDTFGIMLYDIDKISKTPPGKTGEGRRIIQVLLELNKNRNIMYADTGSARGDWDKTRIRISEEYRNKVGPTMVELFHEGTHALYRKNHPIVLGGAAGLEASILDEIRAQANQMKMYEHVKAKWEYTDAELERRLERFKRKDGSFEQHIRDNFGAGGH